MIEPPENLFKQYKTTRADGSSFEWGSYADGAPFVVIPEDGIVRGLTPPRPLPEGWVTELLREDVARPFNPRDSRFDELFGVRPSAGPQPSYDPALNLDPSSN